MQTRIIKPFLTIFLLIALVSLACSVDLGLSAPTPTNAPAPATEAPEEPTEAAEPSSGQPPVDNGGIQSGQPDSARFFTEDFDEDINDWSYFLTSGEKDYLGLELDNGYLIFDLPGKNIWVYALYDPYIYTDVRVEVRAENRGTNNNNISMICRYDIEEGWYEVNVTNGGLYNILYGKWDNSRTSATYSRLADGGSTLVKAGKDVNTYAFVCRGRTLILFINGEEVRRLDDNDKVLRSGQIGIGVSSFSDPTVRVEYDWVKISEP